MMKKIKALFNPERYHGWGKSKNYFEGWYYKIISADETKSFAIIPGIAFDNNSESQSFIQVLDAKALRAEYYKFKASDFESSDSEFSTRIQSNYFEKDRIYLDMEEIRGELKFENTIPWPNKWYSPGIMGPFSFVPFMQCYHGILSMNHTISGRLNIKGEEIDFTGGKGYMEKDWGRSFPSAYFWMQSNHFSSDGISIKVSVAKIPWMGTSFVGFIAGILINGNIIEFTTYNQSKLKKSFANKDQVNIEIESKKYILTINAKRDHATELASPIQGFMDGRISESMTSELHVQLLDKSSKKNLLNDIGRNAGLEVAGNISEIFV